MNSRVARFEDSFAGIHPELADVVQQLIASIQSGEPVGQGYIEAHYSEHKELLQDLLPTIQVLADANRYAPDAVSSCRGVREALGDFEILQEIGRGGMGVVYEARQKSLDRRVALKVLPFAAILDERQLKRFRNEARAAAMLKHPNIVSVYSVGSERGVHFFAMELVEGISLAEIAHHLDERHKSESELGSNASGRASGQSAVTDEGSGSPAATSPDTAPVASLSTSFTSNRRQFFLSVAKLGYQAASALHYAHQEGVVHRDIKPSNLLVDRDGKLWLTDFGLARIQAGQDLTTTGDMIGTLRYMSPEQLAEGRVVDHRADVYSLGLTLYELFTAKPAFEETDRRQVISNILDGTIKSPRSICKDLPSDLETIVLKSIRIESTERYATAGDLAADLQRFLTHRPIHARRVGQIEVFQRWIRRNPLVATLATLLALLLTALAFGSLATALHLNSTAKVQTTRLYARDMRLVQVAIENGDLPAAEKSLLKWVPDTGAKDERGFEWFYLWRKAHHPAAHHILDHKLPVYAVAYSPEGDLLATSSFTPQVNIWDTKSGELVRELSGHDGPIETLAFLQHTGLLVSGGDDGKIIIWNPLTGEPRESFTLAASERDNDIRTLCVSPDENLIIVAPLYGKPSSVPVVAHVWDRRKSDWVARLEGFEGHMCCAFSPDGRQLFTAGSGDTVKIWNVSTWRVVHEFSASLGGGANAMAFHPEGSQLVVAGSSRQGVNASGAINVWMAGDWDHPRALFSNTSQITCVAYSDNGQRFATGSLDDHTIAIYDSSSCDKIAAIRGHTGRVYSVDFSPDDKFLCSGANDNNARIWRVESLLRDADTNLQRRAHNEWISGTAMSPDGRTLYSIDKGGHVVVTDTLKGVTLRTFNVGHPGHNASGIAVSPDGNALAIARGHWPPRNSDSNGGPTTVSVACKLIIMVPESEETLIEFELPHGYFTSLCFSPDSQFVAVPSTTYLEVFDVRQKVHVARMELSDWIKDVTYSPDGRLLACACLTGETHILDTEAYSRVTKIRSDERCTETVDFSPDGKFLATAGKDARIRLWDTKTFKLQNESEPTSDWVFHISFSPDGKRLLSVGKDGLLRVWHAETCDELMSLKVAEKMTFNGVFTRDGNSVVAGVGETIYLFHADDCEVLGRLSVKELEFLSCSEGILRREDNADTKK